MNTNKDQEQLYILDFYNVDLNIGIEVNGGSHAKQNGNPILYTYRKETVFKRANINLLSFNNYLIKYYMFKADKKSEEQGL